MDSKELLAKVEEIRAGWETLGREFEGQKDLMEFIGRLIQAHDMTGVEYLPIEAKQAIAEKAALLKPES